MAGVEQEGQEQDAGPREAARDVADRRELRRPGEDDRAERHRLDRREPGVAGGQPEDEPEARGRDRDPERLAEEPAAAGGERRLVARRGGAQRRKVFAQVPSQTTKTACFSKA